ncbi:S-adenosyl-L-methionine-dependent methyltransferase [Mycena polygramma]|nr:S-adenosyl-L-methionine-dependent methyltransferase [Mycena polygramma]
MPTPDEDDECYLPTSGCDLFYELYRRKFNVLNPTYLLPADDEEIQRSELFHRLIKFIFGGSIFVGPVKETLQFGEYRKVLDVGTGKGSWAVDMCELRPWVYVTGVDLVPIQFQEVPPRCRFEIWDVNTSDMPYENGHFDLIHARAVHTGIRDYPRFLEQVGRILRPGGLIILIELDLRQYANGRPEIEYTFGSGPRGWFTLWETYRSSLVLLEVDVTVPQRFKQLLEATEMFENIVIQELVIPVGFYPEDPSVLTLGQLLWMSYDLLLPALKPMFIHLGLLESRADRIIKDAQSDLYFTEYELSSRLHVVYATRNAKSW